MRSAKHEKIYRKHITEVDKNVCTFCAIDVGHPQFVEETPFFKVIRNRFAYSLWDAQGVLEHLMLVPKRHIDSLADLKSDEKIEYVDILQRYEKRGYSVFARAPQAVTKSIAHQHTHFIKGDGKIKRLIVSLKWPLIRIIR